MDAKKREIRTIDCRLAVREQAEGQKGESRTITGTAIIFNTESQVLDDWGGRFREVIAPEAVTMEFLNKQDIKMNMLHERSLTVARCNKGQGSLRLSVDEKGVNFEFEAPKCDIGERCLEMVRRGDYSGCSFEFWPKVYDEEVDGDDVKITHHELEFISALTIGMDPAYTQTNVNAREMLHREDENAEEKPEEKPEEEDIEEKPEEKPEEEDTEDASEEKPEEEDTEDDEEQKERERITNALRRKARRMRANDEYLESLNY